MNTVVAHSPGEFTPVEIEDFVAFVLAGGEVSPRGLRARVQSAQCIAFLRSGACLVGVAGLKQPLLSYRKRVQGGSKFPLPQEDFPLELGWVFLLPSARGQKLSQPLCQPVIAAAGHSGVFATSRTENVGMHSTLTKLGFSRVGSQWASSQNGSNLLLFVRHVV